MKIRTKLYLCFGVLLIMILLLAVTAIKITGQLKTNTNQLVVQRYEEVRQVDIFRYEVNNIVRDIRDLYYLDVDPSDTEERLKRNAVSREKSIMALDTLDKINNDPRVEALLPALKLAYDEHLEFQRELEAMVLAGRKDEVTADFIASGIKVREQIFAMVDEILFSQENLMRDALPQTENLYRQAVWTFIAVLTAGLLIFFGFAFISFSSITGNIKKLICVMGNISYTDSMESLPRVNISGNDEIGDIACAFNNMADVLEKQLKQEKIYNRSIQETSWLKSTVTEFYAMYQGLKDIKTFGDQLIQKLTPTVGASYGVCYLLDEREGQNDLTKLATYAFDGREPDCPDFRLGEGLAGQCALENRTIIINQAPDNYIRITSGLGTGAPKYIIIKPVAFDGQVVAVVELAALEALSSSQLDVLDRVLIYAGIVINRIINQMKVEKLLKESQALTEDLQSHSEELQLQQEELKTFNEKIEEQYMESRQKTAELEKVTLFLEEKTRQLELSSRYKSEFLANMSHELRTPLNSQLVLAQILAENSEGNLTAKQVEYAKTILSSGRDLLNIINDILDLSKVESGKMEVYPGEVKLQQIREFAERTYLPLAQAKGVEFIIRQEQDLPESIYTDEHKLKQILKNLLSNAFKFTEQGRVLLQIKKKWVGSDGPCGSANHAYMLAISVKDTGIGIPKEKHQVIFEEFQQVDGSTNRKYGGTGLGLSISQKLAAMLGGSIELVSRPGKGSNFTFYLPLTMDGAFTSTVATGEVAIGLDKNDYHPVKGFVARGGTDEAMTKDYACGLPEGKKILIVDDDMRNVFALTAALEGNGLAVLFADNGKAGIKALQDHPGIDLVLMDIMMPEMDGYETMRAIRQMPEYETLPIIALTAKAMKFDREKCIDAGASDYLSKPVILEKLFSLIKVWLYK